MSLKFRIAAIIFVLQAVVVIGVLLNTLSSLEAARVRFAANEKAMLAETSVFAGTVLASGDTVSLQQRIDALTRAPRIVWIWLIDGDGVARASSEAAGVGRLTPTISPRACAPKRSNTPLPLDRAAGQGDSWPMCGRYSLTTPVESLVGLFDAGPLGDYRPRYNIAPSQPVPAARRGEDGVLAWAWLKWGLIPSWAKDPAIGNRMINARAETIAEKPSFRAAFRRRRCLIPADGFYEWRKLDGAKQPHHISAADGATLAFAGLWEHWQDSAGTVIESCTIITTEANARLRPIHPRMPVILEPAHHEFWLQAAETAVDMLHPLLAPYPNDKLVARPVSKHVNDPRHEDPACLEPEGLL